ncbi:phytanoyl-CoA dioxygenase family protein [Candidatus Poribacteria bacterium]|nr:phytanoyl-CoA dioxygenase family protein [Candidatus Poribacteria bacterium]
MSAPFKELRVSNDAMNDPEELRRRFWDEGYLFFKKLQDPNKLWDLRRQMLTVIASGGWLVAGTDAMDGIADISRQCTEGDIEYTDVYHEVYKLEAFHRSAHWPEVMDMMEKVIGRPVLPHPQKIARIWFPKYTEHTTPVHQDFVHFQGNFETYTCWAPVGDCPIELGGLAVLPGSHKVNRVLDHHFSLGAGGLCVDTDAPDSFWHTTNYEIGDTLIFHSLTIHQALPNLTEDRLRVSLDNRYQAQDDPIAEHMLAPHLNRFSELRWEEVYRDWASNDLKYYWKALNLHVVPRNFSYSNQGFSEALALAKGGDARAILHLNRIIKRDPTTEQAKAAMEVLQA